ncbi:Piwi domain-containing protein [Lactarius indigo]|nr:Piwi domain-containing protein [Lactarius indigo]
MQSKSHPSQTGVPAVRQYGTSGRAVKVLANTFAIKTLPTQTIFHYDDMCSPYADSRMRHSGHIITPVSESRSGGDVDLPSRRCHEIVHQMQNITAPAVFNPRAFFDGKKNLFSVGPLKMQGTAAEDYYNEKYGFRLRFPRLFGIVVNVQQKTIVPVEICTIVGGQMYKKVLFPEQMSEVLQHAAKSPRERIEAIERGVQGDFLDYKNSPFFSQIGMQVDIRPMETAARLLQPPDIQYNGSIADLSVQAEKQTGTHGVWNVFPLGDVEKSVMRLKQCCERLGMAADVVGGRVASAAGGVERALEEALAQLEGKISQLGVKPRPPCLVLVVLPDSAAAQRKAVKAWGDVTRQVATQCVKTMKFRNPNDQYCNNVALKINVKLGGINSHPVSQIFSGLSREPTMVVGADVTHPGPGVRDRPSIASLVSSFDHTFSRYAAFTKVQAPRMEVIEELEDMFYTALRYFLHVNRRCPQRVIFYRDGVSDGEFQTVEEVEIKALSDAWNRFAELPEANIPNGFPVPLLFIIVGKRHHLRFFQGAGPNIKDKTGNIFGGLVVDKEVANPHKMDFYLQSHPGLKGTSRPSHYVVLYNKLGFSIDIIQQISYFLCHAYARCTRSVSIPAPVYYADVRKLISPNAMLALTPPIIRSSALAPGFTSMKVWGSPILGEVDPVLILRCGGKASTRPAPKTCILSKVVKLQDMAGQPILPSVSEIYASRDATRDGPLALAFATLFEPSSPLFEFLTPLYGSSKNGRMTSKRASSGDTHALGRSKGLSALSASEQAAHATPPEVLERLVVLNEEYERRYPGLRYITFVNGRSRKMIMLEMEEKLGIVDDSWVKGDSKEVYEVGSGEWVSEARRALQDVGNIAKSRLTALKVDGDQEVED